MSHQVLSYLLIIPAHLIFCFFDDNNGIGLRVFLFVINLRSNVFETRQWFKSFLQGRKLRNLFVVTYWFELSYKLLNKLGLSLDFVVRQVFERLKDSGIFEKLETTTATAF